VHDIGRLAMRDSTEAHFIAGQKILARKPVLVPIATLVRAMNERWDGTGTPEGLRGSAIPLPTRIVAVCGAFDSLTNPLDDTEPMSTGAAILELVERAGTDFDPGVVEPFRDLVLDMDLAAKN
jgi:putative two-component system response regulator